MSRGGLQGFDDGGFAVGVVTGARWWKLESRQGESARLVGAYAPWQPGENIAECKAGPASYYYANKSSHAAPEEDCSCGFWAYWTPEASPLGADNGYPVLGVVEGYGEGTLIGSKGFRSAKAKIVALCCQFMLGRQTGQTHPAFDPNRLFHRGPQGRDVYDKLTNGGVVHEYEEDFAAQAALEVALGEIYGVQVYATQGLMLADHPLTTEYIPEVEPADELHTLMKQLDAGMITIYEAERRLQALIAKTSAQITAAHVTPPAQIAGTSPIAHAAQMAQSQQFIGAGWIACVKCGMPTSNASGVCTFCEVAGQ